MNNKRIIIFLTKPRVLGETSKYEWNHNFRLKQTVNYVVKTPEGTYEYNNRDDLLSGLKSIDKETVIWVKGQHYIDKENLNDNKVVEDDLEQIVQCLENNEILFAYHGWGSLTLQNVQISEYSSSDGEKYEKIKTLVKTNKNKFTETFDNLWNLLQKKPTISLSFIKHNIAHLFLSIDMDLQGIEEVKRRKEKNEHVQAEKGPVDYLKDVLEDKEKEYFSQTLFDLQVMVVGNENINESKGSSAKVISPEKKRIKDLIEDKKTSIEEWNELLMLCGLEENKNGGKYSCQSSGISEFMSFMDSKIGKTDRGEEITTDDVNEILEFFEKKPFIINSNQIKSFHEWFCSLNSCLDKIREALKE